MSGQAPVDGSASVSRRTLVRAWQVASRMVATRPDLTISWADWYDGPDHLVVHDGPLGAALHFDRDDGPTWESRTAPEQALRWRDVDDIDAPNAFAPVDWAAWWGEPMRSVDLTARAAVYALIASLVDADQGESEWVVRPAKLVHDTDEAADAPDSARALTEAFVTLDSTVEWYASHLSVYLHRASKTGNQAVWHEPLWLATRAGEPRVVLDEAGQIHLATESLTEIIEMMAVAGDLGGVDTPLFSFNLLEALPRINGDLTELASRLRRGPADALKVVKPHLWSQQATTFTPQRLPTRPDRGEPPVTQNPTTALIKTLTEHALTVATAESLTGGLLAGELVSVPGASLVFNGGIVSYNTELKHTLLGVDMARLAETGPVDPLVAEQMADGTRHACAVDGRPADLGLATTGVAGPDPDPQTGQPAGTVYLGIATTHGARSVKLALEGDRPAIRVATVAAAVAEALAELPVLTPGSDLH